jgi:hypothetical protein
MMFVSVVIATRNRSVLLGRTLDALARQQWPRDRMDVLVADNGSSDDTRMVVEAAGRTGLPVQYLFVAEPGKSHAVNAALRLTRGDLIAFTDDDVEPEPEWLAGLTRGIEETDADFVAGRILPTWEIEPPAWMSASLHGVLAIPDNGVLRLPIAADGPSTVMLIGANMAFAPTWWHAWAAQNRSGKSRAASHRRGSRVLQAPLHAVSRIYNRLRSSGTGTGIAAVSRLPAVAASERRRRRPPGAHLPTPVRFLLAVPRHLWRRAPRRYGGFHAAFAGMRRSGLRRFSAPSGSRVIFANRGSVTATTLSLRDLAEGR